MSEKKQAVEKQAGIYVQLLILMQLVKNSGKESVANIAHYLKKSDRTVRRYLRIIDQAQAEGGFGKIATAHGPGGGVMWLNGDRHYERNEVTFDLDETRLIQQVMLEVSESTAKGLKKMYEKYGNVV